MASRSKTGISRGISEEDGVEEAGLDWAEQSVAIISKKSQRIGVRICASSCGSVPRGLPITCSRGSGGKSHQNTVDQSDQPFQGWEQLYWSGFEVAVGSALCSGP